MPDAASRDEHYLSSLEQRQHECELGEVRRLAVKSPLQQLASAVVGVAAKTGEVSINARRHRPWRAARPGACGRWR